MRHAPFVKSWPFLALLAFAPSCASETGDPPSPASRPPPAGKDHRIHEIADPASPLKAAHKAPVQVSGAVVIAVDQFDETRNGKSTGTIYVSDLGSKEPYSGISLYNPSFIPGNLRVGAGDALDLRGEFQENQDIPISFAPGAFLVQIATPIATFRFEAAVAEPVVLESAATAPPGAPVLEDLADYARGRKWLNMLVTVKNVTLQEDATAASSGRASARLLPETNTATKCTDPFPKAPTLVNELADLGAIDLKKGKVVKSLTGVVTFFCNFHIAPRSAADIVL